MAKRTSKGKNDVEEKETSTQGASAAKEGNPSRSKRRGSNSKGSKGSNSRGKGRSGSDSSDVAMFLRAGQLSVDTSTFSTFTAAGLPMTNVEYPDSKYTPAGVARYDYIPFFGEIDSVVHPLNSSAKIMYDLINSKNSRNTAYDPSDLMVYVLAVAQAWSLYSWVCRVVGMFNTFTTQNRYWWTPLATTMGISPNSSANDIVKWRNLANRMALKLNMLPVPSTIGYFDHAMKMPLRIFTDSPTMKASLWYLNPAAFFKYSYDEEGKGRLILTAAPWRDNGSRRPEDVESYFNILTENLFNDSDINLIGADIIKAIGEEKCFRMAPIGEDFQIFYEYDPHMNLRIHNATVWDKIPYNSYSLTQDMEMNCLVAKLDWPLDPEDPCNWYVARGVNQPIVLDFPYDDPSHEDFVRATRLIAYPGPGQDLHGCTDMVVRARYFHFAPTGSSWSLLGPIDCVNLGIQPGANLSATKAMMDAIDLGSKFHDGPIMRLILGNGQTFNLPQKVSILSDLTNVTTLSFAEMDAMNKACTLSVFSPIDLG